MNNKEPRLEQVKKALGEPVFIYFSDEVLRMRRNLIILAFLTFIYKQSGAEIKNFHPLGIEFDGFHSSYIDQIFFISLFYSLVHFFWHSFDSIYEWRLRITGTRLAYIWSTPNLESRF